ncbi:SHOCT domain-containing protein [Knoellia sp. DB2414S]|uniref:SHOCT domain-containing protein n=2 Tax=Knoellia koreensis TaxID=2730921 RepID=A0A849HDM7_9MICO|nr:SHOCT domain-containing protein [Knoellia sp. DB2414S]
MAGSLGGERAATFHFVDITGIEYNSGFVTGVLEVLTPSYSGGANKDFWRGSNRSRNADSNDPWTLSNCLPLPKSEYNAAIADVQELKARIGRVKQPTIQVPAPQPPASEGLADQLQKLAALRDSGVLSDEEFSSAKARLLSQ